MSFTVVPKLTEDATLKRARTDLTSETSALTITGVTSPDLTPITDATGTPADPAWTSGNGTVVGLLKGIYTKIENYLNPTFTIGKIVSSQAVSYAVASGDIELTNWQTSSGGSLSVPSGSSAFICNPNSNYEDVQLIFIRNSSGVSFTIYSGAKYILFTSEYYNYMKVVDTNGKVRMILTDVKQGDAGATVVRIQGNDLSNLI